MSSKRKGGSTTFVHRMPEREARGVLASGWAVKGLTAVAIASGVFQIEKVVRKKVLRRAVLPIYSPEVFNYDLSRLKELIRELLLFVLAEDIEIEFQRAWLHKTRQLDKTCPRPVQNICLFSGGVDSYAGLLLAKKKLKDVEAVFCAHSDQSKMIHIVSRIQRKLFSRAKVVVHKIKVPSIGAEGYAQLRGFLYLVASAAWMHLVGATRLVVAECGPTMYQPQFSPFDSVTMTTHPFVVKTAREVIGILLQRDVEITTPFEDLTKAEVMAISPNKQDLKHTHSCVSQRFGSHDGTCYGCVIRRLGTLAAGIEDVKYGKNPIEDEQASGGNLLSLLTYCYDILTGYDEMEDYETENLEYYNKRDLFRRFALDNFAAIHRLIEGGHRVRPSIHKMYESLKTSIGTSVLENRLNELRDARFSPVF